MVRGTAATLLLLLARAMGPAATAAGTLRGKLITRLCRKSGVLASRGSTRGLQIRRDLYNRKVADHFFRFLQKISGHSLSFYLQLFFISDLVSYCYIKRF